MLDPQARALLGLIASKGLPATHELSPSEARQVYRERRAVTQPEPVAMAEVRDLDCPGPGGPIPLRLFRPEGLPERAPLLIYCHGGGWVIGDRDTHDVLCRDLAAQAGCLVLSVDYRLAPEHPFPAAVDDVLAATRWAVAQVAGWGGDPKRLAIGGDSAGGNLAAIACLALRDDGDALPIALQLLIYPATDMRAVAPSHTRNGQGYLLTSDTIAYFRGHYAPPQTWADWRVSPLLHAHHAGLPPAFVMTAGFDPLRDEGRQYADALSAAGTPAQYVCFERQIHGFITMGRVLTEARTAVGLCAQALRQAFGTA